MTDTMGTARSMWTLFEPVHAVTYFAPEALAAFTGAGLRGYWRGYFAGRAAPLGRTGPEVVAAAFFNFAPAFVARAIPSVWELISPAEALRVRREGAVAALRPLLAGREADVAAAAGLLATVVAAVDGAGRVLGAANAALPVPDGDLERLWHACTTLREHRGDGHVAALATADIDGCEAVVLRCGKDLLRSDMQPVRGWTDEQWQAAAGRLSARGLLTTDGRLTDRGRALHAEVEEATDRAASRAWTVLRPEDLARLREALIPLARACAAILPAGNRLGVPVPA